MRHFLAICTVALMSSGLAQNDIPGYQFITTTDSTGIYLSQSTSTWFDANLQAQDLGGHLLTLSSIEENELLNGYDGWIGLYQPSGLLDPDSGWTWVTGEPLLFEIPWSLNEPNDIGGGEDCLERLVTSLWNDLDCNTPFPHFLEMPATLGCTDADACNYDPIATFDDGSCIECDAALSFCGPGTIWDEELQQCVLDPTFCGWQPDSNDDSLIGVDDLLMFLSVFGDTDYDSDGVFDSADDCVDQAACNYQANPSEECEYLDVLGICGGGCQTDNNQDGECDDLPSCQDFGCMNGGLCVGDSCLCADGWEGVDCSIEVFPSSVTILDVDVLDFPAYQNGSQAWDINGSAADIFLVIRNSDSVVLWESDTYYPDADPSAGLYFPFNDINLQTSPSYPREFVLFNYDEIFTGEEFMGGLVTLLYEPGGGFPTVIEKESTTGYRFRIFLSYDWDN